MDAEEVPFPPVVLPPTLDASGRAAQTCAVKKGLPLHANMSATLEDKEGNNDDETDDDEEEEGDD